MQYIEIKESIVEQIEQGLLHPGQKLPSERQLSESFNTTRITLREALSLLEVDGLIYREDRRGWFIASRRLKVPINRVEEISDIATHDGFRYQGKPLSATTLMATKEVNVVMSLPPFSKVHIVTVLHIIDDRPIGVSQYWIQASVCPNLIKQLGNECQVMSQLLNIHGFSVDNIQKSILIKGLEGKTALNLRAASGTPCLSVMRSIYDKNHQVIVVESTKWRHDSVELV